MSCCGRTRETLKRRGPMRVIPAPAPPSPDIARVEVAFRGRGTYLAAGGRTGEIYRFTAQSPRQWVEAGDVAALVATGFFVAVP